MSRPALTRNGVDGSRPRGRSGATWLSGLAGPDDKKSDGYGSGPGVGAAGGSVCSSGSTSGVAKPSGRSMGAYAAPSVQEAMAPF